MKTRRKRQVDGICVAAAVLLLIFGPASMGQAMVAQENYSASADGTTEDVDRGTKSPKRLRQEFYRAEERFYALFNTTNSSDEFDVDCQDEVPFGSRERVHTCKAAFLRKYEDRLKSKYSNRMSRIGGDPLPRESEIDEKQAQLRNEISAAINDNPEMQSLYAELVRAKKEYDASL